MAKKTGSNKSYRELSDELARLMEWFEGGDVDLEEAIENYQKAMKLIGELEDYLKTAENEIKKITANFDDK
jgi:exodeoxyribonuclease VII small subunit